MKPHLLKIEAFGPYAEPVEIGFDELSQEGLFLIHGTTGAGKTFLLDALCFALYGEVSGDRSIKELKSDHSGPAAVPRVSLEFSSGGNRYLVERSPIYTALKTRGEGTTEKAASAVLFRVVGAEREPIVSRITEVTREVEGLVGLNAAQFRQVILLPQGKFAEVLRAKADEREALLKTLFDTVVFEKASYWLEDKAKAARGEVLDQDRALEVLRLQVVHEWSPYVPQPADGEGEDNSDREDVPEDQAGLDRLVTKIAAVVVGTESTLKQAKTAQELAQQTKTKVDKVADRWNRRTAAIKGLEELELRRPNVVLLQQQLNTAEKAEALRTSVEDEKTARQDLFTLQERIKTQLQSAVRARDAAQALPISVILLELLTLPSQDDLGGATNDLAARRAEVSALVGKALDAAQARTKAAEANALAAAAKTEHTSSTAAKETKKQEREVSEKALSEARTARDQLDGLQRADQQAKDQAEAVEAIGAAQKKENDAFAANNLADQQVNLAKAAVLELRHRQISGMAARLAGGLEDGAPCPVCGSSDHPTPAQPSEDAVSDGEVTAAEAVFEKVTNSAKKAAVALTSAQGELQKLVDKAGAAADDPEAARKAATQSQEALAAANAHAKSIDRLEKSISEHDKKLLELDSAIQTASTEIAIQTKSAADEAKQAETLQAEITRELGEDVEPQVVLKAFEPLEAALKTLAASCADNTRATTRLDLATARLAKELIDSEFANGKAVEAALEEEPVRRGWSEQVHTFELEVTKQEGVLASPDLAELPEERPDTAAAQEALVLANEGYTNAVERQSEAKRAKTEIDRLAGEHRQGVEALSEKRDRAQQLTSVANRCQGKADPFISLQRWVLSTYLADICGYANQRLELMTSGRYQLRLTDEGGRGGRNAGLGLRVLDAYTGEDREVSSLSGGETFQASLALALGVADTVQAHAGGVHLEALFIDEGFGTLDPDNLQLAMDELDRLREGGRMIGIISHVGALRERIRSGIEVVASDQGSRVLVGSLVMP